MIRLRSSRTFLLMSLAVLLLPLIAGSGSATAAPIAQSNGKLVLAFYYMWYGSSSFSSGQMSDAPVEPYISNHADVIDRQVTQAQTAGIDAFVSSWTGTGAETDLAFPKLLSAAQAHRFQAAIYFETDSAMQHGDVASQLSTAIDAYANHPAYLHYGGKPVVFFWSPQSLGGPAAWRAVRQKVDPTSQQIWSVDTTDPAYLDVFDNVHLFSAGKWNATTNVAQVDSQWRGTVSQYNAAHGTQRTWTAGVIPGWDESRVVPPRATPKVFPRLDGVLYDQSWQAAMASNPEWISITSWNEWFEGSQIEPSATYGNRYLDLTRKYTSLWKNGPSPCDGGTSFPQTGHSMCKAMEAYWNKYGGLAQFGYPISDPFVEVSPTDGKSYTVQYFERARFELHPENKGTPYEVLLGLLGRQFHAVEGPVAAINDSAHHFFPETKHNVSTLFYTYWQAHGGLSISGLPISDELREKGSDGKEYTVQYFERVRMEAHPENSSPYNVLLGALGRQAWTARGGK